MRRCDAAVYSGPRQVSCQRPRTYALTRDRCPESKPIEEMHDETRLCGCARPKPLEKLDRAELMYPYPDELLAPMGRTVRDAWFAKCSVTTQRARVGGLCDNRGRRG